MDYKEFYECEMKRADKAEDALAAAQARIAELEAQIAKWKEFTGVDEPSWDATLPAPRFATLPIILPGVGKSTADVTYVWKPAKSASDND